MASWVRINDEITINADQITYIQFHDGDALIWVAYCIEDEEHGLIPDAVVLEGQDAERLRCYLSQRGDDLREEGER